MSDASDAAAWVEKTLAEARSLVEQVPLGPRDQPWEDFEASIRGMAAAWLRDVTPYVGLTLDDARERAESTKDFLCVHDGGVFHRANARADRVHLDLDADGRVQTARLDYPPPWRV
jgi:hypothetical protein